MDGIVTKPNSVHWKRPSWYRRRTRLERRLLALAVLLGFVALSLVAVLLNELITDRKEVVLPSKQTVPCPEQQVCLTDECVEAAAGLLVNMNPDADPCTDFYEYSCGGWIKSRVIPEERYNIDVLSALKERLELNCRGLVENDIGQDEPEAIVKAKHFYKACMNEEVINKRGFKPLRSLIRKFGGWPIMNDSSFDESVWNLEDFLSNMYTETGQNYIFYNYVSEDPIDSQKNIFVIGQPYFLLSRDNFLVADFSHKNVVVYREYMEAVVKELSSASEDEAQRQVLDILRLERRIANLTSTRAERANILSKYEHLTVPDLQKWVPQFNWTRYFGAIIRPNFNETEVLGTYEFKYLKRLGTVLQDTPTRTIANLMMWRLVQDCIVLLGRKPRKLAEDYQYQVVGEQAEPPRWKHCVQMTSESVKSGMSAMFIQKYFDVESKEMTHEMILGIREVLQNTLNATTWMDEPTKAKSLDKLLAIREHVGFDDWLKNYTALNIEYQDMKISLDRHFENVIETLRSSVNISLNRLRTAVDKFRWDDNYQPFKANAAYRYNRNQITFPAGFLQHPYYNRKNPQSMNFGGIGVVIGHEFVHGFDNKGRLFDKNGNLNIGDMWTESAVEGFQREANCLEKQYSKFTVEQINRQVNGLQTLGENIADNSGLRVAFKAYRRWVDLNGSEEPTLPGINLTHNQIFFLNFGQLWCTLQRDQAAIYYLNTNSHAPAKFRVLGSVMNSPEFSEAFQCSQGSAMNPTNKCSVF